MARNKARKELLVKMWETRVEALIKFYQSKGKKQQQLVRKLKGLFVETGQKVMAEYYDVQHARYFASLRVWFKNFDKSLSGAEDTKKSALPRNNRTSLIRMFSKMTHAAGEGGKLAIPLFRYKPSPEALAQLILRAVGAKA